MLHFDLQSQLIRIRSGRDFSNHFQSIMPKNELITDIYDGEIYKHFYENHSAEIHSGRVHSYTLCSDGIALCEKSRLCLTPTILSINEIPSSERFCIENIIIGGKNISYNLIILL